MEHQEFTIGGEFWTCTGQWRCTDVGSRTVIAIKLGPREIARVSNDGARTVILDDDPGWVRGPPYAVAETVFDENDIKGCHRSDPNSRTDEPNVDGTFGE